MTTSIDKTTNWRKAVQGVGYKGAADQSAVAVEQINSNPKALQVAKALGQFGNSLGQFGETQAALQAKAQSKAHAQAVKIDAVDSSILSDQFETKAKQFATDFNYALVTGEDGLAKRPTLEQVRQAFYEANPEYTTGLEGLKTLEGRLGSQKTIEGMLAKTYEESMFSFIKTETTEKLGQHVASKLGNEDLARYSALAPEWQETVRKLDVDIQSFDGFDREDAYNMLANQAYIMAKDSQDYRLYEYLLGANRDSKAIGGTKEQKTWKDQITAIKAFHEAQADKADKINTAKQKKLTGEFASKAATLFGKGLGNYTDEEVKALEDEAEAAGLVEPTKVLSRVKTAVENLSDTKFKLDAGGITAAYQRFHEAPTVEDKLELIEDMVRSGELDLSTTQTLLSRISDPKEGGRYKGEYYSNFNKRLVALTSTQGSIGLVDKEEYMYLRQLGTLMYEEAFDDPSWHTMNTRERLGVYNDIITSLQALKEAGDSTKVDEKTGVKESETVDTLSERLNFLDNYLRALQLQQQAQ